MVTGLTYSMTINYSTAVVFAEVLIVHLTSILEARSRLKQLKIGVCNRLRNHQDGTIDAVFTQLIFKDIFC